ncbi:DUF6463 family protein [Deinococcus daejeonensis]|uniref:Uncharacterized protein n=1 Tax=Deinococcus daejeonensis TaxID=1007098 RepID=A0ABQ2JD48_9DEIO|nr:hypothetical protein GCM10010842_30540 [Deinococcus daejeonensis]
MHVWAGRLLIGIAVVHLTLALAGLIPHRADLAPNGLLGLLDAPWHTPHLDRQAAFWSSIGSFAGAQLLWGLWVTSAPQVSPRTSRGAGLALLTLTACQVALAPISGFWLNLLPAALLIAAGVPHRADQQREATG